MAKSGACHPFRHTMATGLEGGADIRYIQAMLGHARLDTIQSRSPSGHCRPSTPPPTPPPPTSPEGRHDGGEARRIAVSELLAALGAEGQDETGPAS